MFEYFAANYFLNSGYTLSNAGASGAPLGDMMVITGTMFGLLNPAQGTYATQGEVSDLQQRLRLSMAYDYDPRVVTSLAHVVERSNRLGL